LTIDLLAKCAVISGTTISTMIEMSVAAMQPPLPRLGEMSP
jgi:hypothetical protein